MNFGEHLLRPSALLALANFLSLLRVSATLLGLKICCQNSPNLTAHRIRDRKEINVTVVEEESRSGFEDFSAADSFVSTCKGKSSIDEWNFPSRSVVVIFLRSLKDGE